MTIIKGFLAKHSVFEIFSFNNENKNVLILKHTCLIKIEIETLLISTAFIYFIKMLSKGAMHCFVSLNLASALKGNLIDCSVFSPVLVFY